MNVEKTLKFSSAPSAPFNSPLFSVQGVAYKRELLINGCLVELLMNGGLLRVRGCLSMGRGWFIARMPSETVSFRGVIPPLLSMRATPSSLGIHVNDQALLCPWVYSISPPSKYSYWSIFPVFFPGFNLECIFFSPNVFGVLEQFVPVKTQAQHFSTFIKVFVLLYQIQIANHYPHFCFLTQNKVACKHLIPSRPIHLISIINVSFDPSLPFQFVWVKRNRSQKITARI